MGIRSMQDRFLENIGVRVTKNAPAKVMDDLMFDTILSELRGYPKRTSCSHAKLAVELTEALLRQRLLIRTGSPAWLDDLDLSGIPAPWRSTACYLSVKMHYAKGEYVAAEVAAKILLQLVEGTPPGTFGDVGLKLACGAICQETDRNDDAVRWYRHAVESALSSGIVIPFLGLDIGPKSGLGRALKGVSPALFGKVNALSRSYFGNLIHFHNRYSGEHHGPLDLPEAPHPQPEGNFNPC